MNGVAIRGEENKTFLYTVRESHNIIMKFCNKYKLETCYIITMYVPCCDVLISM